MADLLTSTGPLFRQTIASPELVVVRDEMDNKHESTAVLCHQVASKVKETQSLENLDIGYWCHDHYGMIDHCSPLWC